MGANPYDEHYDELMLRCLMMNGYRKRQSVAHFRSLFNVENYPHIQWYAYKVYDRVMKGIKKVESYEIMQSEAIENIRNAAEATLERGMNTGDWDPFLKVSAMQHRMMGLVDDKGKPVTVNIGGQHIHSVSTAEDVKNRVKELENALGIAGNLGTGETGFIGGVGPIAQGAPIVDIQATHQTGTGP